MTKNTTYTAADVDVLNDREHVRLRTPIYFGDTTKTSYNVLLLNGEGFVPQDVSFVPAAYKAVGEIIDNALDEFAHISIPSKRLSIDVDFDNSVFTVTDNGRGIPIDKKVVPVSPTETEEKWVPEVLLANLRSGRNFRDSSSKNVGIIGMNGVGAACTNFCSSSFDVEITRDKKVYTQSFSDGAKVISPPKVKRSASVKTGTSITFKLDPQVFSNGVTLPRELLTNRAIEIAATNPGTSVVFNGETFLFKKGMVEIVSNLANGKPFATFTVDTPDIKGEIYVIPNSHEQSDEQVFTWVNSSYLFDGGKCNTQFMNAFFDRVTDAVTKKGAKSKITVTKNDVRSYLTVVASLKIKNPTYDSQSKTRLSGPDMRKELVAAVDDGWKAFSKKFDFWFDECLMRAARRQNKAATDEMDSLTKKKGRVKVDGLLDATGRDRSKCVLYIVEGESAKSQICEVRDPETMASYSLTGKFNNIRGCTPAQVAKMPKVLDLLKVIGLVPGKRAYRHDLNYGKIVISTDADHDGGDIFANTVNLFQTFWPELMDSNYEPFIFRLVAPNVCLVKGDKRVHFSTRAEYEKNKEKYRNKGWTVNYFKGLGSLSTEDWNMVLYGNTDTEIPIVDDGDLDDTMELLFGNDADKRKRWLQGAEE